MVTRSHGPFKHGLPGTKMSFVLGGCVLHVEASQKMKGKYHFNMDDSVWGGLYYRGTHI